MCRRFLPIILLLFSGQIVAAPVIVDFDGSDGQQISDGVWAENGMTVESGYITDGLYFQAYTPGPAVTPGNGDSLIFPVPGGAVNIFATGADHQYTSPFYGDWDWTYSHVFDLYSLDICAVTGPGDCSMTGQAVVAGSPIAFLGHRSDGAVLTSGFEVAPGSGTVVFDSSWRSLNRVEIVEAYPFSPDISWELDNIAVNVVPIPAAVWLFASALIGLGLVKRDRT